MTGAECSIQVKHDCDLYTYQAQGCTLEASSGKYYFTHIKKYRTFIRHSLYILVGCKSTNEYIPFKDIQVCFSGHETVY